MLSGKVSSQDFLWGGVMINSIYRKRKYLRGNRRFEIEMNDVGKQTKVEMTRSTMM